MHIWEMNVYLHNHFVEKPPDEHDKFGANAKESWVACNGYSSHRSNSSCS